MPQRSGWARLTVAQYGFPSGTRIFVRRAYPRQGIAEAIGPHKVVIWVFLPELKWLLPPRPGGAPPGVPLRVRQARGRTGAGVGLGGLPDRQAPRRLARPPLVPVVAVSVARLAGHLAVAIGVVASVAVCVVRVHVESRERASAAGAFAPLALPGGILLGLGGCARG